MTRKTDRKKILHNSFLLVFIKRYYYVQLFENEFYQKVAINKIALKKIKLQTKY